MLFVIYQMFVIQKIAKNDITGLKTNKLQAVTFNELRQKTHLPLNVQYL